MRSMVVLIAAFGLLASGPLRAQTVDDGTRAAARELGYSGVEAYEAGDYRVASHKLDKAFRVLRAPSLGLWSARAFVKVGRLLEASERYREVARLPVQGGDVAVQKQAQAEAAEELEALKPKIPVLVVEIEGASADATQVTIDGAPLASELVGENRPVNPGRHRLEAKSGGATAVKEVTLAEGERKKVMLSFEGPSSAASTADSSKPRPSSEAAPRTSDSTQADRPAKPMGRTLGWIAVGVGGAGLVAGAVTGLLAMGEYGDIEDSGQCVGDRCAPSEQDLVDRYSSLRTISTVGFIGGGILAGTGVVLLLTSKSKTEPVAHLRVTANSVDVHGSF